jgi:hypothetical protein
MLTFARFLWKQSNFLASRKRLTTPWERSLMKVSSSVALAASSALALGSMAPAFAHELRNLPADHGKISLLVGFHVEPTFEDSFNAVDVILGIFDGTCPAPNANVSIGQPIDTGGTATAKDPDTLSLKVDALYLKTAVRPTICPEDRRQPAPEDRNLSLRSTWHLRRCSAKEGRATGCGVRVSAINLAAQRLSYPVFDIGTTPASGACPFNAGRDRRTDGFGCAPHWIVTKVRIPEGRARLRMTQKLADDR